MSPCYLILLLINLYSSVLMFKFSPGGQCAVALCSVVLPYVLQNVISLAVRPIKYLPMFLCRSLIWAQSLEYNNNCTILYMFCV
jgi:hypothetical protein